MTPRKQPPIPDPRDHPDLTHLKAFVDGVTVRKLCDAVCAGDLDGVRAMIAVRPELVHLDLAENDEHRALHYAVLQRQPEMVHFLMKHGADARKGIWPHRDATSPLTIATERGYADIVDIIRDEERHRSHAPALAEETPSTVQLGDAFQRGDEDARRAIATGDTNWLRAHHMEGALASRRGLITHAVKSDRSEMLSLLLEFGLDPDERERVDGLEEVVYLVGRPAPRVRDPEPDRDGRDAAAARGKSKHERLCCQRRDVRSPCSRRFADGAAAREPWRNCQRDNSRLSRTNRSRTATVRRRKGRTPA